jgi:tetratricopeptide (TPR) repeat protein
MKMLPSLPNVPVLLGAAACAALWGAPAPAEPVPPEQLLKPYTEAIRKEKALLERGQGSALNLAGAYQQRGEMALFLVEDPTAAEDLRLAIALYRKQEPKVEGLDAKLLQAKIPWCLLNRGRALRKKGNLPEALEHTTEAIDRSEKVVASGRNLLVPILAEARRARADIVLADQKAPGQADLDRAVADAARAVELHTPLAANNKTLHKELEEARQLLARAKKRRGD